MPSLRSFLRLVKYLLIALTAVVGLVSLLVATPFGLSMTAGLVNQVASSEQQKIEISGLNSLLGQISVDRLTLADESGVWLEATEFNADYSLVDLLTLRVSVKDLSLSRLSVVRAPLGGETAAPPSDSSDPLIPSLPVSAIDVQRVSIDDIVLGEALLGKTARLQVAGRLALVGEPLSSTGSLSILHVADVDGGLQAKWDVDPAQNRRLLDLLLSEPRGGLAARLIGIADLPALDIRLQGDGPLDRWQSDLTVRLDGTPTVAGKVIVNGSEGAKSILAELTGQLAPLLPQSLLPLVAGTSQLNLHVENPSAQMLRLENLTFQSGLARLELRGYVDQSSEELDFSTHFRLGEEGTEVAVQQPDGGSLRLGFVEMDGKITGTLSDSTAILNGAIAGLSRGAVAVSDVRLGFSASQFDLIEQRGLFEGGVTLSALATGSQQVDALLAGTKQLSFKGEIDGQAISLEGGDLVAGQVGLALSGDYAPSEVAIDGTLKVGNLAVLDPALSGGLEGELALSGVPTAPDAKLTLGGQSVSLYDKALKDLVFSAESEGSKGASVTLSAHYDEVPVKADVALTIGEDGAQVIDQLMVSLPGGSLWGDVTLGPEGLATGMINADLDDLAALGPLLLQPDLSGSLEAQLQLTAKNGKQSVRIDASIPTLQASGASLSSGTLSAQIDDVLGTLQMQSRLGIDQIAVAGQVIRTLNATMSGTGGQLPFDVSARLSGEPVVLRGQMVQRGDQRALRIDQFSARWQQIALRLLEPFEMDLGQGARFTNDVRLAVDQGSVTLSGRASDPLDLKVGLVKLPLSLVDKLAATGERPSGQLDLTATIRGVAADPLVDWQGRISALSVNSTRAAGLPALAIESSGRFQRDVATLNTRLTGGGADLSVSGTVGVASKRLDLNAKGSIPFSLAARSLADAGLQLTGGANVSAQVSGSFSSPQINGSISTKGARFAEVSSGLVVRDLGGSVALTRQTATIEGITGRLGKEGTLRVNGTVGLKPESGLPADIKVTVQNGNFAYEDILTSLFNADLALRGQLSGRSVISGRVDLTTTEIMIPEKLPDGLSPVAVAHKNAEGRVAEQAEAFKPKKKVSTSGGQGMGLDLVISAPRRIYVRGRGLDTELGGTIRITGTTVNPNPTGSFQMQRGRMDILTKRLDFNTGIVNFAGTLDPALNFAAYSTQSGTTFTVGVGGYASAPEISLSASPTLPEDEILAQLLFDRKLNELSPIQLAQLANAVATISGVNSGPGLLDKLRNMAGIDNVDVKSDETTNETTVGVGSYLNDRTYANIEKSTSSDAGKVRIELDITDSFKAQGEVSSDGKSKAGIFFEKDY